MLSELRFDSESSNIILVSVHFLLQNLWSSICLHISRESCQVKVLIVKAPMICFEYIFSFELYSE